MVDDGTLIPRPQGFTAPLIGSKKTGVALSTDPRAGYDAATSKPQTVLAPSKALAEYVKDEGWPWRILITSGGEECVFEIVLKVLA